MSVYRADTILEPTAHIIGSEPLVRERALKTSIVQLDEFLDGFHAAQVTLLDSDSAYADSLLHLLCIRAVSELDEEVVWVDGGNTIDPYSMSSMCKRLRLDKREVLSRVNVSRAFTAYQLVALIDERLEEVVERTAASTIIVSAVVDMFLDKDMKWAESYQLLRRCAEDISRIAKAHEAIAVVTSHSHHSPHPDPRMTKLLHDASDRPVVVRGRRDGVLFRLPREGRSMLFSPVPWNQATLDEFRRCSDGPDRAHIPDGA